MINIDNYFRYKESETYKYFDDMHLSRGALGEYAELEIDCDCDCDCEDDSSDEVLYDEWEEEKNN